MATVDLVLLDCSSIQRYVFGSNKLKSNIGASHIVEKIYDDWIPKALEDLFGKDDAKAYETWQKASGILRMAANPQPNWEIGYVGGGNALVLFQHNDKNWAKEFVKIWSRMLLMHAPGLRPAIAIKEAAIDDAVKDIAGTYVDVIFHELAINKSKYQPQTILDRHGITAECKYSGLSAEMFYNDENEKESNWISAVVKSKLDVVEKANKSLHARYKDILNPEHSADGYHFSHDTENLGNIEGESSLIAVVHIDGNSMGNEFQSCNGLLERRRLSLKVDEATENAMKTTLSAMIKIMPELDKEKFFEWKDKKSRIKTLPMRPLILNGDDITFICDARMSFFLAETFLHAFSEKPLLLENPQSTQREIKLSSCAGIAIVKSKYPFYRAYRLAEELCGHAKREGRKGKGSSWLDFQVALNGISGELTDMRKSYDLGACSLLWRPWNMDPDDVPQSFSHFKKALKEFYAWPKNKLHELSQALEQGPEATKSFLVRLDAQKKILPGGWQKPEAEISGWAEIEKLTATPYFDVLEAMDFYPEILLNVEEKK